MNFFRTRWIRLGTRIAVLGGIGIYSLREKYCVTDFDTWWHLKVGDWIIRNAALPHTGILSCTAAERAWVAYSWGYEVLLLLAYSWFGLVGIGALGTILTVGVAFSIYWMLRRIGGNQTQEARLAGFVRDMAGVAAHVQSCMTATLLRDV
jgi:hypothetical protein